MLLLYYVGNVGAWLCVDIKHLWTAEDIRISKAFSRRIFETMSGRALLRTLSTSKFDDLIAISKSKPHIKCFTFIRSNKVSRSAEEINMHNHYIEVVTPPTLVKDACRYTTS